MPPPLPGKMVSSTWTIDFEADKDEEDDEDDDADDDEEGIHPKYLRNEYL